MGARGSKPGERRGGRKAGVPNKATRDIRALAQEHSEPAIRELARLAIRAESEQARVSAIKELLDRGYGKPLQRTEGSLEVNIHDGARDKLRTKLDRVVNPGSAQEPISKPH